jgi:hypothetical protein
MANVFFLDPQHGFLAAGSLLGAGSELDLHFADPRTAWLVQGHNVFATADGRDTWQTIAPGD